MTKTFTTTKGEYLLVEVPEDRFDFKISHGFLGVQQIWYRTPDEVTKVRRTTDVTMGTTDGPYSIISLLKDITEEQAKEIVEINQELSYWESVHDIMYKNYSDHVHGTGYLSAKDSVESLLFNHGIDTSLNCLLLKKL